MTTLNACTLPFKSPLSFKKSLPTHGELKKKWGSDLLVIYDERLLNVVPGFKRWIAGFEKAYKVKSGEELKSAEKFGERMSEVMKLCENSSRKSLHVIAIGGGSVGDFAGFAASVFKRGVGFIQMPSTWLAALDSAHGGKTALNLHGVKNQIGTFYPARTVYIVEELLKAQPPERAEEALGEFLKIALLDGGPWVRQLEKILNRGKHSQEASALLFKYLKNAIDGKLKFVVRDPYETSGIRDYLNLGHTTGHVIESFEKVSHGAAVSKGLCFAIEWSRHRSLLKGSEAGRLLDFVMGLLPTEAILPPTRKLKPEEFLSYLRQDKKISADGKVNFIFLRGFGKAKAERVAVEAVLSEAIRQKWVLGPAA